MLTAISIICKSLPRTYGSQSCSSSVSTSVHVEELRNHVDAHYRKKQLILYYVGNRYSFDFTRFAGEMGTSNFLTCSYPGNIAGGESGLGTQLAVTGKATDL